MQKSEGIAYIYPEHHDENDKPQPIGFRLDPRQWSHSSIAEFLSHQFTGTRTIFFAKGEHGEKKSVYKSAVELGLYKNLNRDVKEGFAFAQAGHIKSMLTTSEDIDDILIVETGNVYMLPEHVR